MPSMPEELFLEKPLAIVGDEDTVLGFKALGFMVYSVKAAAEVKPILEEVIRQKSAVCLVQEDIYRSAEGLINNYNKLPLPILIPFSKSARTDLLDKILQDAQIRATGTFQ